MRINCLDFQAVFFDPFYKKAVLANRVAIYQVIRVVDFHSNQP
jgi:hypothetical protein